MENSSIDASRVEYNRHTTVVRVLYEGITILSINFRIYVVNTKLVQFAHLNDKQTASNFLIDINHADY